ncbi:MAG: hypothetical protein QXS67_02380, partial [Candidatus Nezhaarchaeales archaeon]
MLDPHDIELPKKILIGKNVINSVGDVVKSLGLSGKAYVLLGKTGRNLAAKSVLNSLTACNYDVVDYDAEEEVV